MAHLRIGITCYPTFGGSGVVATELGMAMARGGDDVHFISYALPSRLNIMHERVRFHEVTVTPYPLFDPYPPYTLALATKMAEVVAYEKLDILHVHYAIPHAISAYLAKQVLRSEHLKVITTLHGTDITLVGRDESYLPITKFGIEVSDGVTAVSRWLKEETATHFSTDKPIEVIPNFVDPGRFRPQESEFCHAFAGAGEKLLCHVSNFRPVKRIMDVIEVFEKVTRIVPSRLLMVGDGPDRSRAEAYCRDRRLRDRVLFLGNVPNIEEIVGSSHLFLLPSESESFGMAALEAMASEVPVIATRTGGLPEVVDDGETGFLLPVGDVDRMAARAVELLSDEPRRREMGRRAREAAIERFDVARIVPQYRQLYERVLAGAGAPAF
ncbi:MAG TPA: N-acetyl-alpha-D-glucosaminyl L-malate synthase BshA [Thermoanaerobaculia bacterium]|nr:N-acetyl-alpha-D-glucosaminyl L-malate synthase BshA [Thermoanaerobaculia bacterium]